MPSLVIQLPARPNQTEFNLRRWEELLDDPELARIEGRIETDRHGRAIWRRPESVTHSLLQTQISIRINDSLRLRGNTIIACPVSTADGVKAADVAWASEGVFRELGKRECFVTAPEICAEVQSNSDTDALMEEKRRLYFDAGAKEVWNCSMQGEMSFYLRGITKPVIKSKLCPEFPKKIAVD